MYSINLIIVKSTDEKRSGCDDRIWRWGKRKTFLADAGRYFSREDLIEGAIGAKYDGYDRAVDSHIKNLRQKIEDNPNAYFMLK